jgi:hypothetical protein
MKKQRIMSKQAEAEGLIALPVAIKRLQANPETSWWPETSIRDAVVNGDVPSIRASLRPRAKIFVRMEDLEAHMEKLKQEPTNDE